MEKFNKSVISSRFSVPRSPHYRSFTYISCRCQLCFVVLYSRCSNSTIYTPFHRLNLSFLYLPYISLFFPLSTFPNSLGFFFTWDRIHQRIDRTRMYDLYVYVVLFFFTFGCRYRSLIMFHRSIWNTHEI